MRSALSFQKALFAHVKADAGVIALVDADKIKSHIQQDTPNPYIRMRCTSFGEYDCKSDNGFDIRIVADVWTNYHGDKEQLEIADALITALHKTPLTLDSGDNFFIRFENLLQFTENDGQVHHAVVEFRALVTGA